MLLRIFFCILISTLSTVTVHAASTPVKCPGTRAYVVLQSAPEGYVCMDGEMFSSLKSALDDTKRQLRNGYADTRDALSMSKSQQEYYNNPSNKIEGDVYFDEWKKYYNIYTDRISTFSRTLCTQDLRKPKVILTGLSIYDGDTLTPSCAIARPGKNTKYDLDISIQTTDLSGNRLDFVGNGDSFSGISIVVRGVGKHTIRCSYRPNYCQNPKIVEKSVQEVVTTTPAKIQKHSIARTWNEVILNAIRKDRVRPPVQARNLFHWGAAVYDAWSIYNPEDRAYLYGQYTTLKECRIPQGYILDKNSDIAKTISYISYRMIESRYRESPGYTEALTEAKRLMNSYGYDTAYTQKNIERFSGAATLGNAIAACYLAYGKTDGSNEAGGSKVSGEAGSHANLYYAPINPPLAVNSTGGNIIIQDWNRWQPLSIDTFIDQAGNPIAGGSETFIGAEWGNVLPFSLRADQQTIHERDGNTYTTYLDPGIFPQATGSTLDLWRWNFELVALWSSHLDGQDNTMIDISPASLGETGMLPTTFEAMKEFYDTKNGGTKTVGHTLNPKTGKPYTPNRVKRGDYARIIAEFWADGPTSETPAGHWFTILNTVSDSIGDKRWQGTGKPMSNLEWDIKSYFTLGGSMHDAAIGAWGIKGAYDGIRPVSAIRAMAVAGQSSNPNLPSYSPMGFTLIPGHIELVETGDILEGRNGGNIGKIKIRAWKGPRYINNTDIDAAGVDWILAENWWPYQRSSFVTPPFAGYVSGHSTFSRAAAETLTAITGDPYFPGGLMRYTAKRNNYLVFEQGPTTDITLEWATYRDAANESALSRIWGGIHPPMDDIPGRILGEQVGKQAFEYANSFFGKK